jgi:WD40 repeat protein
VIPAFSPDGRFLAVGLDFADRTPLRLLDPRELRPATPALDLGPAAGGQVEQVDFSPGGDHLAAVVKSADGSQVFALVWELAHPDQPPERVDLDPVDQGLALGPRGRVVYTQQPLTAYDVRTGRQLWRRPVKGFRALDLNRTGTQLAMERWDDKKNNDVLLVDARNGHVRRTLVGQAEQVLKVRYSTDGRLLASSAFDGSLVIWDTSTGEVRERMQGAPFVTAMALSPDAHTLYSAAGSEPVRVWDLTGDRRFLSKQSSSPALPMYSSSMWPTQNASKFAYFWGNDRGTFVRFVDTSSGHATVDRNTHQDGSFAAGRWSPDSLRWATGDGRGRLLVFDPSNARQVASGKVLPGLIDEVEYTADGRSLVAVDDHGRVRVADATTLRPTSPVLDLGDWGCCLAAAPHSHSVVVFTSRSGNDGVQGDARHWAVVDTDSARIVRQGTVPSAVFYSDWSPDGTTIVGVGAGNRVLAIDERTGRVRVSAPASQNTDSYWVRYSRDGRELVSAAINGSVSLWDSHLRLLGTVTTPQEVPAAAGSAPMAGC